ncbi:MAG: AbgT family transporter [Treponema sp.]|nr:AbgT family transporter [Treponema sp.]MCL2272233.1 AbgT family transporter [Treponema sp.]
MEQKKETSNQGIRIEAKSFYLAVAIIFSLMMLSGIFTKILPAGSYDRITSEGRTLVINGSYREIARPDYPIWRWFTAPFEVLAGPDSLTPIVLIVFFMIVGGSISILDNAGVMKALVSFLVSRFSRRKYTLIIVMIFFFMAAGSFIGMFEEMVPLVIFIVPIAISLGWDSLTGLGMSLLPMSFGFAAAVSNPFTIAVAQKIAGLPLFSGAPLRLVFFAVIFLVVCFFVIRHAKKIEKNPESSICYREDEALRMKLRAGENRQTSDPGADITKGQRNALAWFGSCIALAMVFAVVSSRVTSLADLAFPVLGIMFLIGGTGGGVFSGLSASQNVKAFGRGVLNFLPGVLLVLMAYSVKHIISEGMIMDTILDRAAQIISRSSSIISVFWVYLTTLVLEFFIGSASAKAFLLMPLLSPLADLVGITRQTTVLAFGFGDGFSNVIFPTNALLLIALSFTVINYAKWIRWTWKLQLIVLFVTLIFLVIAVKINYGPF